MFSFYKFQKKLETQINQQLFTYNSLEDIVNFRVNSYGKQRVVIQKKAIGI
jgi:hypothetical protein